MSIDFHGYFQVDIETLDLDKLSLFFERNHLQYQGYSSYYELRDDGSEQYLGEISAKEEIFQKHGKNYLGNKVIHTLMIRTI